VTVSDLLQWGTLFVGGVGIGVALINQRRQLNAQMFIEFSKRFEELLRLLSLTGRVKTLAFRRRLSARARRINFGDGGIPTGRAHCI
jgi:hypothetical protein